MFTTRAGNAAVTTGLACAARRRRGTLPWALPDRGNIESPFEARSPRRSHHGSGHGSSPGSNAAHLDTSERRPAPKSIRPGVIPGVVPGVVRRIIRDDAVSPRTSSTADSRSARDRTLGVWSHHRAALAAPQQHTRARPTRTSFDWSQRQGLKMETERLTMTVTEAAEASASRVPSPTNSLTAERSPSCDSGVAWSYLAKPSRHCSRSAGRRVSPGVERHVG